MSTCCQSHVSACTVDREPDLFLCVHADLLLIGTGSSLQRLHPDLQAALRAKGVSFDALDTVRPCLAAFIDHKLCL